MHRNVRRLSILRNPPKDLRRKCPICGAARGFGCVNLNQTSYPKPLKGVHPERKGRDSVEDPEAGNQSQ
jgi:hypothetical protein